MCLWHQLHPINSLADPTSVILRNCKMLWTTVTVLPGFYGLSLSPYFTLDLLNNPMSRLCFVSLLIGWYYVLVQIIS